MKNLKIRLQTVENKKDKCKTLPFLFNIIYPPKFNDATIAHYFLLYSSNIEYYGGKAQIIPPGLANLRILLNSVYQARKKPTASDLQNLFGEFVDYAKSSSSEKERYKRINNRVQTVFINQ